jgi:hypothetical protein
VTLDAMIEAAYDWAERQRMRRGAAPKRAPKLKAETKAQHGTISRYAGLGCRCAACKKAMREYNRQRYVPSVRARARRKYDSKFLESGTLRG